MARKDNWDSVIEADSRWLNVRFKEIYDYRDLLSLFVRRDFVSQYKQTILGPLWFFIQPIFSTIIFTVIFGRVAEISTDGVPQPVFYLSGIVLWNYFGDCLTKTSETFHLNQTLFGKVYFPRLIVPLSLVVSNLMKLGVQLLLLTFFIVYYLSGDQFSPSLVLGLFPVFILISATLGLGIGLVISALTTKYRDLRFLVQFGVQLAMYATPIVYPLSIVPEDKKIFFLLNPITSVVEGFRAGLFGVGEFSPVWLTYSFFLSVIMLLFGILLFNRVERSFVDTI